MTNETVHDKGIAKQPGANWQATRSAAPGQGPLFEDGDGGRPPAGENLVDGGSNSGPDSGGAAGAGSSARQPSLARKQTGSGGLTGGATRDDAEGEEPPPRPVPEAILEFFKERWMLVVGVAAVLFVVILLVKALGGGAASDRDTPERAANDAPPPASGESAAPRSAPGEAPTDTGVAFEAPAEEGGDYYIKAGELAWKGKRESTDSGERITVEGATAAQFTRAVALPGGSITTGVIGRAEPEGQTLHATYQQVNLGEDQKTSGTYYTVADGLITSRGSYSDEREGEAVTRTYDETRYAQGAQPEEATYAVTFDAPPETPIPVLVGHEDPPTG